MKQRMMVLLITLFVLLVAVGCQSNDKTTFEEILADKEMTFAMTGAYPPFNFINEQGNLDGFDIEIANALAAEMGVKAVPITTAWDGIIGGLTSSRFDTIIGSMAVTKARLEQVNFTKPYYYDGAQFFAPENSKVTSLEGLENGTVGVVTGTTFHDALKTMDNIEEIMQFESDVDNFMALEQGRMDGLVTGKFVGLQAPKKYGIAIKPVGQMLYAEEIAIAVRKEDEELLNALNEALAAIIENGTYEDISNKWFGTNILEK
ncbi:MAG TPA: transporter substrate-binding domain-containing protein [Patescibacteria group bacterium]|nr:transporter substrate-binding domain-containing protein [Patescibacteria group bacterium]